MRRFFKFLLVSTLLFQLNCAKDDVGYTKENDPNTTLLNEAKTALIQQGMSPEDAEWVKVRASQRMRNVRSYGSRVPESKVDRKSILGFIVYAIQERSETNNIFISSTEGRKFGSTAKDRGKAFDALLRVFTDSFPQDEDLAEFIEAAYNSGLNFIEELSGLSDWLKHFNAVTGNATYVTHLAANAALAYLLDTGNAEDDAVNRVISILGEKPLRELTNNVDGLAGNVVKALEKRYGPSTNTPVPGDADGETSDTRSTS